MLVQVDDFAAAPDLRPQLDRALSQEPFDDGLRYAEDVGMGGIRSNTSTYDAAQGDAARLR